MGRPPGRIAQLAERGPYKAEVGSSSLPPPTIELLHRSRVSVSRASANGGLEADAVEKAIQDACGALQKQMASLTGLHHGESHQKASCPACRHSLMLTIAAPNPTEVARATAHTTKALDEMPG